MKAMGALFKGKLFGQKPRHPERIIPFLGQVATLWLKYPDLRFFQIVQMIQLEITTQGKDPFYMEELDIQECITSLLKRG